MKAGVTTYQWAVVAIILPSLSSAVAIHESSNEQGEFSIFLFLFLIEKRAG
jgi:hypothetical protein